MHRIAGNSKTCGRKRQLGIEWDEILTGITQTHVGATPLGHAAGKDEGGKDQFVDLLRDRRGATGLANGLAISVVLWALIALVASLLFH